MAAIFKCDWGNVPDAWILAAMDEMMPGWRADHEAVTDEHGNMVDRIRIGPTDV